MMDSVKSLLEMVIPVGWFLSGMPEGASTQVHNVDPVYHFLLWTCTGLFLMVVVPLIWFTIRYRKKSPNQKALTQKDHNFAVELTWTLLPCIYLAILFIWGFNGFLKLYTPPINAKELKVVGQKWQWTVQYPDEDISVTGQGAVIGVVVNQPVKLVMTSQDVIHSFFVPNFRVKQDVLPMHYSTLWFEPTKVGEFPVLCAEYCGDYHSNMLAKIKVMTKEDYADWVESIRKADVGLSPRDLGAKLYEKKGCVVCHSTDGTVKIGPSFKGVYGHMTELSDGKKILVDDAYIQEHVLTPGTKVVKGFPPVMPSFKGQLSETDINGIIAFIKSLK